MSAHAQPQTTVAASLRPGDARCRNLLLRSRARGRQSRSRARPVTRRRRVLRSTPDDGIAHGSREQTWEGTSNSDGGNDVTTARTVCPAKSQHMNLTPAGRSRRTSGAASSSSFAAPTSRGPCRRPSAPPTPLPVMSGALMDTMSTPSVRACWARPGMPANGQGSDGTSWAPAASASRNDDLPSRSRPTKNSCGPSCVASCQGLRLPRNTTLLCRLPRAALPVHYLDNVEGCRSAR